MVLSRFVRLDQVGCKFSWKMERKSETMEQRVVEQELSKLMAFTLELEDELNACVKYEQWYNPQRGFFCYIVCAINFV